MGIIGMMVFIGFNSTPTQNQEKDSVLQIDPPEMVSIVLTEVEQKNTGYAFNLDEIPGLGIFNPPDKVNQNYFTYNLKITTTTEKVKPYRSPRDGFRYRYNQNS